MAQSFVIGLPHTVRMTGMGGCQMCYFVTYSRNRIRFEFLTTRLGDCELNLFFDSFPVAQMVEHGTSNAKIMVDSQGKQELIKCKTVT